MLVTMPVREAGRQRNDMKTEFPQTTPISVKSKQTYPGPRLPTVSESVRRFLARVAPMPDPYQDAHYFNIHWTVSPADGGKPIWTGRAVRSIDEAEHAINHALVRKNTLDIYFCLSAQSEAIQKSTTTGGKYLAPVRRRANAIKLKSIWLDIDVKQNGDGYVDLLAAARALCDFRSAAGMPAPTFTVVSGGGLHVYWTFETPITVARWQPIADALAEATRVTGLKCDIACTVDAARVLRVPGTFNRKLATVRSVRIVGRVLDRDYPVQSIEDALKPFAKSTPWRNEANFFESGPVPDRQLSGAERTRIGELCDELSAGIVPPIELDKIEGAGMALAAAGRLRERDGWRDLWLFPIAHAAREHTELENELKAIFDKVSLVGGGDTSNNEDQWRHTISTAAPAHPRTLGSTFDEAQKVGWQPPAFPVIQAAPSKVISPLRRVDLANVPRHRQFLLGTRLLRGEVTILAAPGGRAKTALAIAWACSLSYGRSLVNEHVFGPKKRVLYISTEDNNEELQRRFIAAATAHSLSKADVAHIYFVGVDQTKFTLTTGSEKVPKINGDGLRELAARTAEAQADVVVLDPLGPLVPVGLNDNGLMGGLLLALKQMAFANDFALLLVHHYKKSADGSQDSVSGAAALVNHSRAALTIEYMNDQQAQEMGVLPSDQNRWIRVADLKVNLAPRNSSSTWLYIASIDLPNDEPPTYLTGDSVQAIVIAPPTSHYLDPLTQKCLEDDFLKRVRSAESSGEPLHANARGRHKGASTAVTELRDLIVAQTSRPANDAARIAESLFDDMKARDVIEESKVETKNRKKRQGVIVGPKAPSTDERNGRMAAAKDQGTEASGAQNRNLRFGAPNAPNELRTPQRLGERARTGGLLACPRARQISP
jgi:AAA domain